MNTVNWDRDMSWHWSTATLHSFLTSSLRVFLSWSPSDWTDWGTHHQSYYQRGFKLTACWVVGRILFLLSWPTQCQTGSVWGVTETEKAPDKVLMAVPRLQPVFVHEISHCLYIITGPVVGLALHCQYLEDTCHSRSHSTHNGPKYCSGLATFYGKF